MLHGQTGAKSSGINGAGIVGAENELVGPFVDDLDGRVDFAIARAGLEQQGRLLTRILGQQLKVLRDPDRVRRLAWFHRRQTAADVRFVVKLVALDGNLADFWLDHPQFHDALGNVLLGQQNLRHTKAALAINLFERLQRALNIAEVFLRAGES